jgi:hypothetical protein
MLYNNEVFDISFIKKEERILLRKIKNENCIDVARMEN